MSNIEAHEKFSADWYRCLAEIEGKAGAVELSSPTCDFEYVENCFDRAIMYRKRANELVRKEMPTLAMAAE